MNIQPVGLQDVVDYFAPKIENWLKQKKENGGLEHTIKQIFTDLNFKEKRWNKKLKKPQYLITMPGMESME